MNTSSFSEVGNTFAYSQLIWQKVVDFMPTLIAALIVLVGGFILAALLGKLVTGIARSLKVDKLMKIGDLSDKMKELEINFTISGIFGWIVKWFIIIATLLTVSSMMGLETVANFLTTVLLYIPNILVAVVILTIGLIVGNFLAELVEKSIKMSDVISPTSVRIIRAATRWTVIVFAIMAALSQLGIAPQLIQVLFTGIVMMFSLAGGLAFGLGGKDKAQEFIERIFGKRE